VPLIDELLRRASWTRRLARSLLAGDEDDAVQEAFLSALRRPPDLSRPLEPWLRTVVSHQAANRARHERRRRTREEQALLPAGPGSPEDGLAEREIHRLLAEAVAALPEPHREAVQLRYFDELSSPEIAARLGVPAGTVRSRVKAALEELGRALDRRAGGRGRWRPAVAVLLAGPPLN
jgi:RNA polymerase sigma-70 factor (ECF subfamily)